MLWERQKCFVETSKVDLWSVNTVADQPGMKYVPSQWTQASHLMRLGIFVFSITHKDVY